MDLNALEERIARGRELNAFDQQVVDTVAELIRRVREAAQLIREEGMVSYSERGAVEHPAVKIERQASMEIRGWVKDRPDLFGEPKRETQKLRTFTGLKAVN